MLFCLWDTAYKRSLAAKQKEYHTAAGFLSQHNGMVNVLSASLNKTFGKCVECVVK